MVSTNPDGINKKEIAKKKEAIYAGDFCDLLWQ